MRSTTHTRLVTAAFELFLEQGYDKTTIDDIAERAGTGRTTFFRYFPSKDDVVFPDHDSLLPMVDARLATATTATADVALREAARIVLDYYLSEGDLARTRYRLTRTVPALHDRELTSVQRYFRLFALHARRWLATEADGALRGELLASAVITAHNYALRSWLRGTEADPHIAFDRAINYAIRTVPIAEPGGYTIVIRTGDVGIDEIVNEVRDALTRVAEPTP